ncbi:MAG: hypothetical protein PVI75_03290 [Gammaproteobacteria bacterium]|jgi:hypothetical protein
MAFVFWLVKSKGNKIKELDKVVRQAKQVIGKKVTSNEGIPPKTFDKIPTVIEQIDKYIKKYYTPVILIFLKAQLLHKSGRIKPAISCYKHLINNKSRIQSKVILAKTYIGMANITNQKSKAAKQTNIKGEKHNTCTTEFINYINKVKKLLSIEQINDIMNQYHWPYKKTTNNLMAQKFKKKKNNILPIKVKPI